MANLLHAANSRVWTVVGGTRPDRKAQYQGLGSIMQVQASFGSPFPVYERDLADYDKRVISRLTKDPPSPPQAILRLRSRRDASELAAAAEDCEVELQLHIGLCSSPSDFDGWQDGRVIVLHRARASQWMIDDVGAMDSDASARENLSFSAASLYEIRPLVKVSISHDTLSDVTALAVGDVQLCPDCPKKKAVVALTTGTDGWTISYDGGLTWETTVSQAWAGNNPSDIKLHNGYVVLADPSTGHRYVLLPDETDALVTNSNYTGDPIALYVNRETGRLHIAAEIGWLYYLDWAEDDPTTAHNATALNDDLNAIHGAGSIVVAVGDSNSVMVSRNDGATYRLVAGPSGGGDLQAVWCVSETVWFVGDASGGFFYTVDAGTSWTEITGVSGSSVTDIAFFDESVGYVLCDGLWRTIDGGASWMLIGDDDGYTRLAVVDQNTVVVGKASGFVDRYA